MFVRKTSVPKKTTGKIYWNYQLVESVRTEKGPRHRILLHLGADLDLNDIERKALGPRINELLKGIQRFIPCSDKVEEYAQRFARILREQMSQSSPSESKKDTRDLKTLDVNTIEIQEPRTVGAEHLLLHVANELKLPQQLSALGLSKKELALALGCIIGRAVAPQSERATLQWLRKNSGLGELIDLDFDAVSLNHFYKIGDTLLQCKPALERHLSHMQQKYHSFQRTLVLYDLTNTYLEGRGAKNPKARHGVSKEKRRDCPLVTLGLVVDEHGFVINSSLLPGNISEPLTLKKAIERLDRGGYLSKPIVILDAGIATEGNLKWLRDHEYNYIVSARQQAPSTDLAGPLESVNAETAQVRAAYIKTDHAEEQWLYCESEAKAATASKMKALFQERLEIDLTKLAEGLKKPRGRRSYPKVLERVGRLREKHKTVSGCYDIVVEASEDGTKALSMQWVSRPEKLEERLHSHYFLRTNLKSLSPEALWRLYGNLKRAEDAFRFMKSSLGMRPIYHQNEERVDAHLWITVLAYYLISSCLYMLKQHEITDQWETVRRTLTTRIRGTVQSKMADGRVFYHRATSQVEPHQRNIYAAIGISPQILRSKQSVV